MRSSASHFLLSLLATAFLAAAGNQSQYFFENKLFEEVELLPLTEGTLLLSLNFTFALSPSWVRSNVFTLPHRHPPSPDLCA
jgi:hypothetical protein